MTRKRVSKHPNKAGFQKFMAREVEKLAKDKVFSRELDKMVARIEKRYRASGSEQQRRKEVHDPVEPCEDADPAPDELEAPGSESESDESEGEEIVEKKKPVRDRKKAEDDWGKYYERSVRTRIEFAPHEEANNNTVQDEFLRTIEELLHQAGGRHACVLFGKASVTPTAHTR